MELRDSARDILLQRSTADRRADILDLVAEWLTEAEGAVLEAVEFDEMKNIIWQNKMKIQDWHYVFDANSLQEEGTQFWYSNVNRGDSETKPWEEAKLCYVENSNPKNLRARQGPAEPC